MTMTAQRWQEVKKILEGALEQPPGQSRAWALLACGEDAALWQEVESLLRHEEELEGFIEEPVLATVSRSFEDLDGLEIDKKVGPYRLLRLLGKGGMGAVYLAVRDADFEQQVALKLLHPGAASDEAIRRFESERQILARLQHPNIARLLDGGKTTQGLPYFAMEVVEGLAIDQYCDEQGLDVPARLRLFLGICSALQLAHQSLVIHRDLKPGNILVGRDGVPKLLDFGIAKLLQPGPAAEFSTQTAQRAFTLHYASPEQMLGEPAGTRSDVYSLGVVLYQVLTGVLPGRLTDLPYFELLKSICEIEPPPASEVAPVSRRRQLLGDVDAILAKALRKGPAARYASVENLADDLLRHLENRPVLARQGNYGYLFGKFVRRHRFPLLAAVALVGLALAFTMVLMQQLQENKKAREEAERAWRETETARQRAEGVSDFLIQMFQAADPERPSSAPEPSLRELLAVGRTNLATGLHGDPQAEANLSLKLGEVYFNLGDYGAAEELFQQAFEIWQRSGDRTELATALASVAGVHVKRGQYDRGETLLRQCIAIRRSLGLEDDLLKPLGSLATILLARGEAKEAEAIYRETLSKRRERHGPRNDNVAVSLRGLASALMAQGRLAEAEPHLIEAVSIWEENNGPNHTKVALGLAKLGELYQAMKRSAEARDLLQRAVEIQVAEKGDQHLDTVRAKKSLAAVYLDLADLDSGCRLLAESLMTLRVIRPGTNNEVMEAERLLKASCPATS